MAELSLKGGSGFGLVERELSTGIRQGGDITQRTEVKNTTQHKDGLEETAQQAIKA